MTTPIKYRISSTATKPVSDTVKGAPLTSLEIDGNFRSIKDSIELIQSAYLPAGYSAPVDYVAGVILSSAAQTVAYQGEVYAPKAAEVPFTTSGVFEVAKFVQIQSVAGVDLAATDGASLIGYDGGTVQDVLDGAKPMQSYAALRAYTGRATAVRITAPGIAGFFQRDADTTTADNGGTVVVDASGRRWKRVFDGAVSVKWFVAVGNGVADDTAAIQSAINAAIAAGQVRLPESLQPNPNKNFYTITRPTVFFQSGTYKISDRLTFSATLMIKGENSIINQSDFTKEIFYTTAPFVNEFDGLSFVGGKHHIFAQNGPTGVMGIESAQIRITNCEFNASDSYAVVTQRSGAGGGMIAGIERCRFLGGKLFGYFDHDVAYINDCWIGSYHEHPADTALFVTKAASLHLNNNLLVPGLPYNTSTDRRRWVDAYGSVFINQCRFGSENGGIPLVYSFHDQSLLSTYPFQGSQISITDCNDTYNGSTSRTDEGFIVLKRGLPQVITIENNIAAADGPYIRTDMMDGAYTTLSSYLDSAFASAPNAKRFSFRIKNNGRWGATITQSAADTAMLTPYMEYDNGTSAGAVSNFAGVVAQSLTAKNFAQTSTDGAVSIVDTGIKKDSPIFGFSGYTAIYDVLVTGNIRTAGSTLYRAPLVGSLIIGSDFVSDLVYSIKYVDIHKPVFSTSGSLSVSAVFWDGSTESETIPHASTAQIRIKVGGYVNTTGAQQEVRLIRRM